MIPTLRVGDLILVNKFHYGVRLPVINTKVIANHEPQRGDVMVFRYPPQPSLDYIKRVIGLPGDEVAYLNKTLTVNGQPVPKVAASGVLRRRQHALCAPVRGEARRQDHRTLNDDERPSFIPAPATSRTRKTAATASRAWSAKVPAWVITS